MKLICRKNKILNLSKETGDMFAISSYNYKLKGKTYWRFSIFKFSTKSRSGAWELYDSFQDGIVGKFNTKKEAVAKIKSIL